MKQLVMVGLVGLICACSGRGGSGGPPPGEPVESFGLWYKDGYTFYSTHDPKTQELVIVQATAVWRCNIDGTSCTNVPLAGCLPAPLPNPSGSSTAPVPPPPVACPAVCNCMSSKDCNYYCGNSFIDTGGHPFPTGISPVPGPK
jgi:hypothetical protein